MFEEKEKYKPNLDPVPELPHSTDLELPHKNTTKSWNRMKSLIVLQKRMKSLMKPTPLARDDIALASLLKVIGAPLTPAFLSSNNNADQQPSEGNSAKYIVKQYVAAVGGERALSSSDNLCAKGNVKITMSNGKRGSSKFVGGDSEHGMPRFELWQKRELWCMDLMLSAGYKVCMGSDGKAPLPWHHTYAYQVPPLPLGHLLQGLNPCSSANLFSNSDRLGDKPVNKEDCFRLEVAVKPSILSSSNVQIVRHTIFGYFSQKTGLLVKLEDSRQLRLTALGKHSDWKSTMESYFQDYRANDGVNIAHRVSTYLSLRGESLEGHSLRRKMKLIWKLEEVGLDIKGLSIECFLPPNDLETEEECCGVMMSSPGAKSTSRIRSTSLRFQATKIIPIDDSDRDLKGSDISDEDDW
ncbi:uncharacterized protein LOC126803744 [Argentina anserina]|uniref:uncharacterized protein LOC126803744 n=1 Tax=Argentina anserina TaxID=57926 RepID=UPI00217661C2|nr:uncharacterized protein LOC126803744 [Potentilla anserina]